MKTMRLFYCLNRVLFSLSLYGSSAAIAANVPHPESAVRAKNESFRTAYSRYLSKHPRDRIQVGKTASEARLSYTQLDLNRIPVWQESQTKVAQYFSSVRDLRFLTDPEDATFKRRSSWLYPDDGCFARAELLNNNLEALKLPRPAKLFIFGDLVVKTKNAPSGSVAWWYHVVPLVRVGQVPMVLDPAIEASRPLPMLDWIKTMTSNVNSVTLSICNPHSYSPSSDCDTGAAGGNALADQQRFLTAERSRLVSLGRNPANELGDHPPWLRGQGQHFWDLDEVEQ